MKVKCNTNVIGYMVYDVRSAKCFYVASELFPNRMMPSILGKKRFSLRNEKHRKMIK